MMVTPTFKMLWLTMVLAALTVLVAGAEKNTTSTASPKVQVSTTTAPPQPFAPVMDLFQAPLAAFKPKMHDNDMPMGRDQQSLASTPAPSNIFIKAGNNLGSAASSLTGWFNNRMIPQAFRPTSTTTAAPQVFAIVPSQQLRRKVYIDAGSERRRPQGQIPIMVESDDLEDDEEELNDNDDDEDNYNSNQDIIQYDDEEEDEDDYEPVKDSRQTQIRPNRQYYYIEEELPESDDFDYDVQLPVRKPQRKQQNLANKRRKTSTKKKQQKRRKPLRRIQNPQTVQYVQNRPSKTQVKRQRRPATTFELIPINQNQAINSIENTQSSSTSSQNNSQRPLSQFLSIPWSRLGFSRPSKEPTTTEQQSKPIIVQIPQQNVKRKRRPAKKPVQAVKNPKRNTFGGQLQNQSPVFSILSEDQIREIFNTQVDQPSKTTPQTSNLPVTLDTKKKPPKKESEEVPLYNNDNEPEEQPQAESEAEKDEEDSFIVVGSADEEDDKEVDLNLYRHFNNQRGFKRGRASPRISHRWVTDDEYDE